MYKVIDLFAGAGGLSLGFAQTEQFEIEAAFENNSDAQLTYGLNHPGTILYGDVCVADYGEINRIYGPIDVVIGGPPCQGFSNANRQRNHAINQNNMLVKQYVRAILELKPKAFVMENVSMLRSQTHRFYLNKADQNIIKQYNIDVSESELLLIEEEYKESDFIEIVKSKNAIRKNQWNNVDIQLVKKLYRARKSNDKFKNVIEKHNTEIKRMMESIENRNDSGSFNIINQKLLNAFEGYYEGTTDISILRNLTIKVNKVQLMLERATEIFENEIVVDEYNDQKDLIASIRSFSVYDYLTKMLGAEDYGYVFNSDILCAADYGVPQKRHRFVLMGIKKDITEQVSLPEPIVSNYYTVKDAIGDLEEEKPYKSVETDKGINKPRYSNSNSLLRILRDSDTIMNHIVPATRKTAMERFKALKEGENFHALKKSMRDNTYSDSSRTQNTIYLRLKYDEPSGTVINVRKSMWIHPKKDRAISVREAARLQSFPDSFEFKGKKDSQYQQVGNAVPPLMARAIAEKLADQLAKDIPKEEY